MGAVIVGTMSKEEVMAGSFSCNGCGGTGYTTSYTGNDGEGYNYAYCRTNNATPPNIPASLTVVRLEGLSDNQGISASDGSIS